MDNDSLQDIGKPPLANPEITELDSRLDEAVEFDNDISEPVSPNYQFQPLVRRSDRVREPPAWLRDYVHAVDSSCSALPEPVGVLTPPTFPYIHSNIFTKAYYGFLVNITTLKEPTSYRKASQYIKWVEAMDKELDALESNQTSVLTDLPPGKRPIGSKWVYKVKTRADGSVERFKARLVAKDISSNTGLITLRCFHQ